MKTEKIKTKRGTKKIFEKITTVLKNSGLVAFPTETVYGL
jgi:tRNA A37 threonylcarbamoyladenosine synthetase subunit TsaC/SUA5/YrdC